MLKSITINYQYFKKDERDKLELLPLCELSILNRDRRVLVRALVDTGAMHSIFPESAAEDAGIDLSKATLYEISYGASKTMGRLVQTYVEIAHHRFRLEIVFAERLILGFALLGRKTFFNQFNEVAFIERIKTPRVEFRG